MVNSRKYIISCKDLEIRELKKKVSKLEDDTTSVAAKIQLLESKKSARELKLMGFQAPVKSLNSDVEAKEVKICKGKKDISSWILRMSFSQD